MSPATQTMAEKKPIILIARETGELKALRSALGGLGYAAEQFSGVEKAIEAMQRKAPQAILLEAALFRDKDDMRHALGDLRGATQAPVIAILAGEAVGTYDPRLGPDDFVTASYRAEEVAARIKQALWRKEGLNGGDALKFGDLVIDLARFSVTLAGRPVSLTFTEYQLLKFLAGHKGQAFTRESLLNQVWGYDYFGGDRTVDVHVTRLRDKIEDSTHTYIETVRGVGYRFKETGS